MEDLCNTFVNIIDEKPRNTENVTSYKRTSSITLKNLKNSENNNTLE